MAAEIRIQDMTTDEIADFLRAEGNHLTEEQAAALQEFIDGVGGLENAYAAVDMLSQLNKAA